MAGYLLGAAGSSFIQSVSQSGGAHGCDERTIVREFARLRIRRVPFLGVPREFVRDRARGRRVVQEVPAHGHHAGDFFGHQGRMFQR